MRSGYLLENNIRRAEEALKDIWFESTLGEEFRFISFGTKNKCILEFKEPHFQGEYNYSNALKGSVKNLIKPFVKGVGYMGVGSYNTHKGKMKTSEYNTWINMISRCYTDRDIAYQDCSVADEWHNFQNFAEWCNATPEFHNEDWCLDKDVIIKGNKTYSPETCAFVPRAINNLFTLRQRHRGGTPLGVSWNKGKNYFTVNICKFGKNCEIARTQSAEEGFAIYKIAKENYVKEVAEIWKDKISVKVYEALINYQVKITD